MGYFERIFGMGETAVTSGTPASAHSPLVVRWEGDGYFETEVVGESYYQDALEAICGPRCEDGEDRLVTATLVCDDKNAFDPNAVRVEIADRHIGHLAGDAAPRYRAFLKEKGCPGATVQVAARITGGWSRGSRGQGHYGVRLDIQA